MKQRNKLNSKGKEFYGNHMQVGRQDEKNCGKIRKCIIKGKVDAEREEGK